MNESIENGICTVSLSEWRDYVNFSLDRFLKAPAFVFRGHSSPDWELESTLDRLRRKYPHRKIFRQSGSVYDSSAPPLTAQQQLLAFRRAAGGTLDQWVREVPDEEMWAIGRHYGLATPLLDWSRSPFAALFFAFDDEHAQVGDALEIPDRRIVFALSTSFGEKSAPHDESHPRVIWPDFSTNLRANAQSSYFIYMPDGCNLETYIADNFRDNDRDVYLYKIEIKCGSPAQDRLDCLVALHKMGINHRSLFPDPWGAAKFTNSLWQPGHEDPILYD